MAKCMGLSRIKRHVSDCLVSIYWGEIIYTFGWGHTWFVTLL